MAVNESMNEGRGGTTESSRSSFVSSQASSSSSMDCNQISHPEYSSSNRIIASEIPSTNPTRNHYNNSSSHLVKKEEERLVLSVKTIMGKEEDPQKHRVKHRDSPRPPKNQSKLIMEGTLQTNGKQKKNIKESLRVLSELRDVLPRSSYEATRYGTSRDAPRFSYDGRERNRLSFEPQSLNRSGLKIKELPRLSLDGREGSVRSSKSAPDPSWLSSNSSVNPQNRPTSVVVKLMGLEPLPDCSTLTGDTKSDNGSLETKSLMSPPKNSLKAPTSPKKPDMIMKPTSSLKFPVEEAAPWKQQSNGYTGSNKPGFRPVKGAARTANDFPSVYGEIEKRLQHLEFKKSGKDLRALKQILEALQTKGLLETRKEEQASNFGANRDYYQNKQSNQVVSSSKPSKSSTSQAYESPIVIIKPGKIVEKSGLFPSNKKSSSNKTNSFRDSVKSSSRKEESSKALRTTKQSSSRPQQIPKESNMGSSSPRIQQKKVDLEKRSRPPTPPAPRRGSNKQEKDLGEACQGPRWKQNQRPSTNLVPCADQLSEVSNESRSLSCQGDDVSEQSDSNFFLELKNIEVSSSERLIDVTSSSMSLPMKAEEFLVHGSMENNSTLRCDEDSFQSEFKTTSPEQPSPVSVLDPSVYRDDELSPIKDSSENLDEDQLNLPTMINRKKLQNIDDLVQKLRRLNSHHDEGKTDYIASLCENTDPDKRYISEILLASGLLLRDLGSNLTTFQLHSSSHPINPELFLVLEQTKTRRKNLLITEKELKWDLEKFHRKLIFDVVNEILAVKLASTGPASEPWVKPKKLAKRDVSAQRILKDVCFEIERFQGKKKLIMEEGEEEEEDGLKSILTEDVMRRTGNWTDFESEISGLVLDVERSIFKDLVSETVNGEVAQFRANKLTRQLFS